jgi:hypothetical protein
MESKRSGHPSSLVSDKSSLFNAVGVLKDFFAHLARKVCAVQQEAPAGVLGPGILPLNRRDGRLDARNAVSSFAAACWC